MTRPVKTPPPYAIASVDHALRLATILQLEGELTVAVAAERLSVARSTAHRLLQMLVYRDFAVQLPDRRYAAGPVLELAAYSPSQTARLRGVALRHMHRLVQLVGESSNLAIRTGSEVRFIASVESAQTLRVGSREGMVFPAHRTSGGLVLLAELDSEDIDELYADRTPAEVKQSDIPDLRRLKTELARVRRQGFAVNQNQSERGVVALGVSIHDEHGTATAALSITMPSVRYRREDLPKFVGYLRAVSADFEAELAQ